MNRWRQGTAVAKDGDKIRYQKKCPGPGWLHTGVERDGRLYVNEGELGTVLIEGRLAPGA